MQKTIFIMLLGIMLATTNGLAENNTPIVPYFAQGGIACSNVSSINADTWHCINYADMFGDIFVTDVTYTLSSDTTIHSMHYTKLIKNNNQCVGALRQSADGMKVYYYDVRSSEYLPDVEECLLYDFSANIGDTIKDAYFRLEDIRVYDCLMEPESVGWLVTDKYISDGRNTVLTSNAGSGDIIPIASLPRGRYILTVVADGNTYSKPFIK